MPRFMQEADNFATPEEVAEAREKYGSTEIEIDEDALASRGEDGVWVQAWVFLPSACDHSADGPGCEYCTRTDPRVAAAEQELGRLIRPEATQ